MSIWTFLAVLLVFILLEHLILTKWAAKKIEYHRSFSVSSVFEGESAELVEVLRNPLPVIIPWVRVESRISPYLRFGSQENLSVSGERFHKSIFFLSPFQQITRHHYVTFAHRGIYDVSSVALTIGDLFGVSSFSTQLQTDCRICVYPKIIEPNLNPLYSKLQGEMIVKRYYLGDPFLVNGIREYRPGDLIHDIHWASTAKTGQMMVRTHDYTAETKLMIVLNSQLTEQQWGNLMDYEQAAIEHAISLAASVCLQMIRSGQNVGFAANMPTIYDDDEPAVYPPDRCLTGIDPLLEKFASLKVKTVKSFITFMDSLSFLRGTDILILTAYMSPSVDEKINHLRALGNTVTVCRIDKEV